MLPAAIEGAPPPDADSRITYDDLDDAPTTRLQMNVLMAELNAVSSKEGGGTDASRPPGNQDSAAPAARVQARVPPPLPASARVKRGPTRATGSPEPADTFFPPPDEPRREETGLRSMTNLLAPMPPVMVALVERRRSRRRVAPATIAVVALLVGSFAAHSIARRTLEVSHSGEPAPIHRAEIVPESATVATAPPVEPAPVVAAPVERGPALPVEIAQEAMAPAHTVIATGRHHSHSARSHGVAREPAPPADESPEEPPAPAGPLTAVPSEDQILRALERTRRYSEPCIDGRSGWTRVNVTFANTGRVTTATVGLPLAGTPVGSCLALALRHARVQPFTQPTFSTVVQYRVASP